MSDPTPVPSVPAPRPAPCTDLRAFSRALNHLSSAGHGAVEGDRNSARRLIALARIPAAQAFPAGSREADALAVILGVLGGQS